MLSYFVNTFLQIRKTFLGVQKSLATGAIFAIIEVEIYGREAENEDQ